MPRKRRQAVPIEEIASELKKQGLDLESHQILVPSAKNEGYTFAGIYENADSKFDVALDNPSLLELKCRKVDSLEQRKPPHPDHVPLRRGQERRIATVIELVRRWQQLRTDEGLSMKQAASRLATPQKTLDDYARELDKGFKKGFDFLFHRNSLMGVLRHFNHSPGTQQP